MIEWANRQNILHEIERRDITSPHNQLLSLLALPEREKRVALEIIYLERQNKRTPFSDLYSDLYSHLKNQPDLVRLIIGGGSPREATDRLVVAYLFDQRRFRDWLEAIWRDVDRNIFLKLWDVEQIRPTIAGFIEKGHLFDNPELLLKWWSEGFDDRLIYFIHSSLLEIEESVNHFLSVHDNFTKFLDEDPFGKTILKASKESDDFGMRLRSVMEFMEDGIRQPHSEAGQKLEVILNAQRHRSVEYNTELVDTIRGISETNGDETARRMNEGQWY